MDHLLRRVRAALLGAPEKPSPPPANPSAETGDLLAVFRAALAQAGGTFREFATEAEARAAFADDPDETGVDRADLLLADTGTVVRHYGSREESRVSLVPPRTVFLATRDAIVPDMACAFEKIAVEHRRGPAYTVFITGPSRTADIEKQLVIPAHGPRELVVALIDKTEQA
jgi:L-lactate utilization protein LutC